jgi:hypothetical protein
MEKNIVRIVDCLSKVMIRSNGKKKGTL